MIEKKIRKLLHFLRTTPLHPQWYSFRDEKKLLTYIGKRANGIVVDIGCGTRRLEPFITATDSYIGIDYEPTAKMYNSKPDINANAQILPIKSKSVNTVCMLEVMEHIPDPEQALAEASRILKPNGEIIFSTPFLYPIHDAPYDYQRWTEFGIQELAKKAQLSIVQIKPRGTPIESAVLNLNIALSRLTLRLLQKINPLGILLLITFIPLILITNLLASVARLIDEPDSIMPFGYMAIFRKHA